MIATGRKDDAPAALRRAATEMPPGQYQRMLQEDPALADVRNDARFLALAGLEGTRLVGCWRRRELDVTIPV